MTGPFDDRVDENPFNWPALGEEADDQSVRRRYTPHLVIGLATATAMVQFVLFPIEWPPSPLDVIGEGMVVAVLAVALFLVTRVDETQVYRPLMSGVSVFFLFALTDWLDEVIDHPEWFTTVFENGAQTVGAVLLVAGIYRWTVTRREREAELSRRSERLAILNRVLQHDIRNDTMVVRGWASVLKKEQGDAADDRLDRIVTASNGIINLTESAAEFTDVITTTTATAELEPKPLASTVENELEKIRARYGAVNVEVDGSIPDVDVLAHSMLPAVFRNLLVNAAEHDDVTEVRVSAERSDATVSVRVATPTPLDRTPGEPGTFEDDDLIAKGSDDSFGLSLVGALVEQFDGDVFVDDDRDESAFVVVLRVVDSDQSSADAQIREGAETIDETVSNHRNFATESDADFDTAPGSVVGSAGDGTVDPSDR
ncbi:hypothetical protein V5735_20095 [Haladaptatus sp. SPP-AMP-3]|uniref:sensor histidine kinase n=1 Tax=Haladaptatus sp. SPP-AMP-3 TaxID=3121295 RepID=UPI003C2DB066